MQCIGALAVIADCPVSAYIASASGFLLVIVSFDASLVRTTVGIEYGDGAFNVETVA